MPISVRPQPSRVRQNSNNTIDGTRARAGTSLLQKSHLYGNGVTATATTAEANNPVAMSAKSTAEVQTTPRESTHQEGHGLVEEGNAGTRDVGGDPPAGGSMLLQRSSSKPENLTAEEDKSDEQITQSPRPIPPPVIPDPAKLERPIRGRGSKAATPVLPPLDEYPSNVQGARYPLYAKRRRHPARPRMKDVLHDSLSPTALPAKRSHKKGAGLAAQAAALQAKIAQEAAGDGATGSADVEQEREEEGVKDQEERYCYCHGVSYGAMVACDAIECPTEWFHLHCVGLERPPGKNSRIYHLPHLASIWC